MELCTTADETCLIPHFRFPRRVLWKLDAGCSSKVRRVLGKVCGAAGVWRAPCGRGLAMSGRSGEGSYYTVGLVSTPAPQHLSSTTTNIPPTYSATFTTTPLQHLDYTLASMSSGYTLPPLYNAEAAAIVPTCTCPSSSTISPSSTTTSSSSTATGVSSLTTGASSTTKHSFTPTPSFPRYGTGSTFTPRFGTSRPGVVTSVPRSTIITTRPPAFTTLTTPTITTYTTYNPAINKFTTHTPTTTSILRYRPNTTTFTARPITTTTTSSRFTSTAPDSQVYTLASHFTEGTTTDSAPPATHPPPPRVTLASTATAHRPGPTWPLRVNLSSSEGYDNLDLDLGEDVGPPKGQVRTHMTKEQFLAVPQPQLELHEAGDQGSGPNQYVPVRWSVRRGWQSAQERLEERRRGGVWSLSLFPTSTTTPFTTTFTTSFTTFTTTGVSTTEGVTNMGNNITTTTFTNNGAYCNQAVEGDEEEAGGVWTVEGDEGAPHNNTSPHQSMDHSSTSPPLEESSPHPPPPHPDTSDSCFTLHDVPLRGEVLRCEGQEGG
ncbi:hypothetical protein Hamer_G010841 [Homarus americanus]|uniref:Uncharacterized protein n=1 Tax=Homarus americanus TaxID=6706 RepID=A0A8J5JZA8_HOMAM|nr:hypothetical protein Hamer_G010841 [Homarus americanus]